MDEVNYQLGQLLLLLTGTGAISLWMNFLDVDIVWSSSYWSIFYKSIRLLACHVLMVYKEMKDKIKRVLALLLKERHMHILHISKTLSLMAMSKWKRLYFVREWLAKIITMQNWKVVLFVSLVEKLWQNVLRFQCDLQSNLSKDIISWVYCQHSTPLTSDVLYKDSKDSEW